MEVYLKRYFQWFWFLNISKFRSNFSKISSFSSRFIPPKKNFLPVCLARWRVSGCGHSELTDWPLKKNLVKTLKFRLRKTDIWFWRFFSHQIFLSIFSLQYLFQEIKSLSRLISHSNLIYHNGRFNFLNVQKLWLRMDSQLLDISW